MQGVHHLMYRISGIALLFTALLVSMITGISSVQAERISPSERERERIEISFLTMTIDHHEGAIQMARLVEQRATHTELKTFAAKIIKDQTDQQQQMQQWLKEWYGITKEPKITAEHKAMVDQLTGLTGAEFEKAFLQDMIKHHRMGMPMMRPAARNAAHPQARELAQKMITDQQNEIKQMRRWLKEWYKITVNQQNAVE